MASRVQGGAAARPWWHNPDLDMPVEDIATFYRFTKVLFVIFTQENEYENKIVLGSIHKNYLAFKSKKKKKRKKIWKENNEKKESERVGEYKYGSLFSRILLLITYKFI